MIASFEKKPAKPMYDARNADAGQRQRADDHQPVGGGDHVLEPAHLAACPARRASAWMTEPAPRNSSALKKAWVKRWKIAAPIDADAERHEHVAELRAGRVGDHALDVVLHEADRRGEERGERADDRSPPSARSATPRTAATGAPP